LKKNPEFSKIGAGLACGFLWTIAKGLKKGDLVLCPDGSGTYHVGEITSDYSYVLAPILPHRRSVQWFTQTIDRSAMSDELWNSVRAGGMISDITRHQNEINKLINASPTIISNDPTVEDPVAFAMEKHLEDFLVQNWSQTEISKEYNIYEESGEKVGQQYPTDTGPMDILAISKDKKRLLVVELKKGRASDVVVGQVLRYMGYVQEELAENGQTVSGVIIALEDDQRIRRALAVVPSINFYRYQISFKLLKT
jgi:restriction system protein